MDCAVYLINFIFIRQNHNEGITRSIGVKYVVCSPIEVVLKVLSSTVWRSAHSLRRKNFTKNLISTTSACYIWILKPDLYFSIGKITTLTAALMHSFRVWYVQCLAKRLTLNLIEFIHLKVGRSFDSLAVKNFMKNWTTTKSAARLQNPTAFVSENCLAVTQIAHASVIQDFVQGTVVETWEFELKLGYGIKIIPQCVR